MDQEKLQEKSEFRETTEKEKPKSKSESDFLRNQRSGMNQRRRDTNFYE